MLGTSDAWSMSCLSHQPSEPAYYNEDCRILISLLQVSKSINSTSLAKMGITISPIQPIVVLLSDRVPVKVNQNLPFLGLKFWVWNQEIFSDLNPSKILLQSLVWALLSFRPSILKRPKGQKYFYGRFHSPLALLITY